MNKAQKFDYIDQIEQYLNDREVYELFDSLLQQLIVQRPENPHQFLIQKLKAQQVRRIFLLGAPGSGRTQIANTLKDTYEWRAINTGKLLTDHVAATGPHAARIQECIDNSQYVDDSIVIELVQKEIAGCEKKQKSWIIEGFPRTRCQAQSL